MLLFITDDADDDEKKQQLESMTFLVENPQIQAIVEEAVRRGQIRANGTLLARDLSNQPANHLTPTQLADKAEAVAAEAGYLTRS